jgi:predicted MFS family arabinose efflux permease
MDKTELPFTVKDGMLTGPNGSWRIKDISAVFSETKDNVLWIYLVFFGILCVGSVVGGWQLDNGALGFIYATAVIIVLPFYILWNSMRKYAATLKVFSVIGGTKIEIWTSCYGSRSESEVKAQGEALVSLIRGAIEQNANS